MCSFKASCYFEDHKKVHAVPSHTTSVLIDPLDVYELRHASGGLKDDGEKDVPQLPETPALPTIAHDIMKLHFRPRRVVARFGPVAGRRDQANLHEPLLASNDILPDKSYRTQSLKVLAFQSRDMRTPLLRGSWSMSPRSFMLLITVCFTLVANTAFRFSILLALNSNGVTERSVQSTFAIESQRNITVGRIHCTINKYATPSNCW